MNSSHRRAIDLIDDRDSATTRFGRAAKKKRKENQRSTTATETRTTEFDSEAGPEKMAIRTTGARTLRADETRNPRSSNVAKDKGEAATKSARATVNDQSVGDWLAWTVVIDGYWACQGHPAIGPPKWTGLLHCTFCGPPINPANENKNRLVSFLERRLIWLGD